MRKKIINPKISNFKELFLIKLTAKVPNSQDAETSSTTVHDNFP